MSKKQEHSLRYFGSDIIPCRGDCVRFADHPDEELAVEDVIDTMEKRRKWGVDTLGLMLKGKPYGLLFEPGNLPVIEFVSRKKQ